MVNAEHLACPTAHSEAHRRDANKPDCDKPDCDKMSQREARQSIFDRHLPCIFTASRDATLQSHAHPGPVMATHPEAFGTIRIVVGPTRSWRRSGAGPRCAVAAVTVPIAAPATIAPTVVPLPHLASDPDPGGCGTVDVHVGRAPYRIGVLVCELDGPACHARASAGDIRSCAGGGGSPADIIRELSLRAAGVHLCTGAGATSPAPSSIGTLSVGSRTPPLPERSHGTRRAATAPAQQRNHQEMLGHRDRAGPPLPCCAHPLRSITRRSSHCGRNDDDRRHGNGWPRKDKCLLAHSADQRTCGPAIALFTIPTMTVRMAPPAPPPTIWPSTAPTSNPLAPPASAGSRACNT
jgi:hypothetical protein